MTKANRSPRKQRRSDAQSTKFINSVLKEETQAERVRRIYAAQGGPLIGWLFDEARRRGHDLSAMAKELGVTYGYINQLRSGIRSAQHIGQEMAQACARYLGVPTIVVKIICGRVLVGDFAMPNETEEQMVERALERMTDDPQVRRSIPVDMASLGQDAKKALVMLYAETTNLDFFEARQLPQTLSYLQRAALNHEMNEFEAIHGHRDTSILSEGARQ